MSIISKLQHLAGLHNHDYTSCIECYEKINSVVHIHNWNDETEIREDRSCGCEFGTYCGNEIYVKDGETYCGEYIGVYSSVNSWTWSHWVDEEHFDKKYCKGCYKKWKADPTNFEKEEEGYVN